MMAVPAMTVVVMAMADFDDYLGTGRGDQRSQEEDCE
jgi:hypothetical protein